MTDKEAYEALFMKAWEIYKKEFESGYEVFAKILHRLSLEALTPALDPDKARAKELAELYYWVSTEELVLRGMKEGRELAALGNPITDQFQWFKHDGSPTCPVHPNQRVCVLHRNGSSLTAGIAAHRAWETVGHYIVLTRPLELMA